MNDADIMTHYDRTRDRWLDRYGTLDYFDEWYDLMLDVDAKIGHQIAMPAKPVPRLGDVLRDIAGTNLGNGLYGR